MTQKKAYILGPTTSNQYFGGVAVFDDELAKGLKKQGWLVRQFTRQKTFSRNSDIYQLKKGNLNKFIKKEKPDLVIASLQYGIYFRGMNSTVKKVYVLHGFFEQEYYGGLKSAINTRVQKYMLKYSDVVVANSYFTKMINQKFFGIKSDFVQHLAVSEDFLEQLDIMGQGRRSEGSYIFVGRLVEAKGIRQIVEAAKVLESKNFEFNLKIVGEGPLKEYIQKQREKYDLPIELLGRKNQQEIVRMYQENDCFISLNPSEPFGIVFLESLISGCKIICPHTGGQIEFLRKYNESVSLVDESDPSDIANSMIEAKGSLMTPKVTKEDLKTWTYSEVAKQLVEKINHDK